MQFRHMQSPLSLQTVEHSHRYQVVARGGYGACTKVSVGNRIGSDGFESGPALLMIEQEEGKAYSGDSGYCVMYLP